MGRFECRGVSDGNGPEAAIAGGMDFGGLRMTLSRKQGVPDALIVFSDHPASPEWRQAVEVGLSMQIPVMVFPSTFSGC